MSESLKKLEKLINSELASKVQKSVIEYNELMIEINEHNLIEVVQFLKSQETCKFRQLVDIAGVDYPDEDKRFELVYLFFVVFRVSNFLEERNCSLFISIQFPFLIKSLIV